MICAYLSYTLGLLRKKISEINMQTYNNYELIGNKILKFSGLSPLFSLRKYGHCKKAIH